MFHAHGAGRRGGQGADPGRQGQALRDVRGRGPDDPSGPRRVAGGGAPIPGTTKPHGLEENLGAASVQLTADDLRDIEGAVSRIEVHGARYPEHLQKMVGR